MEENAMLGRIPGSERQLQFSATTRPIQHDDITQDDTVRIVAQDARPPSGPRPRGGIPRLAILVATLVVLVGLIVPAVLAASTAMQDYSSLKALGLSGLNHLLKAKDDVVGMLPDSDQLKQLLGDQGATSDAPYTYLMQHQAGTNTHAQVTIHPAPNLPGNPKTTTYRSDIGKDTGFTSGGTAASSATPTPTATPTRTPQPSATATGSSGNGLTPSPDGLKSARAELVAAQQDFRKLNDRLDHPDWVLSHAGIVPGVGGKIATARTLADIGIDGAAMGIVLLDATIPILTRLQGKSLNGNDELLTQANITSLQKALKQAQGMFNGLQAKLASVQVSDLPVSDAQKAQFADIKAQLPRFHDIFDQVSTYIGATGWLLGTGKTRRYLVQTLDTSELRGTGGFEGHFGTLTLKGGKISPFSLLDVNNIDYVPRGVYNGQSNGWVYGRRPPPQYSWWPVANWGLRDANLNSDFPTAAKLIMQVFQNEGGGSVDGLIQFTPDAIASMLRVTGPLRIPQYNEVVTADNLEDKVHYYQENPAGIRRTGEILGNTKAPITNRSYFLRLVTQTLEDNLRHLKKNEVVPLLKQLLLDLRTKDIQVYFKNKDLQDLLHQLRADSSIATPAGVDGLFVSQMNVSVSKGSPQISSSITDSVALDAKGGATHTLKVSIKNKGGVTWNDIFGSPTYRDYVRIYVPAGAKLHSADGFDTGRLMCSGGSCGANPYPQGERICPAGAYLPGQWAPSNYTKAPAGSKPGQLNYAGSPTNTRSDVSGRAMWGGWVVIPPHCTANLTLSYYVPHVVNAQGTTAATPTATKSASLPSMPIARLREGTAA
jgi:hypothetical protein